MYFFCDAETWEEMDEAWANEGPTQAEAKALRRLAELRECYCSRIAKGLLDHPSANIRNLTGKHLAGYIREAAAIYKANPGLRK